MVDTLGIALTSGPIALYRNVPIHTDYYQPQRFYIEDIDLGTQTIITTTVETSYVIGQEVRLIIPADYGCYELNGRSGIVLSFADSFADDIPYSQNLLQLDGTASCTRDILVGVKEVYSNATVLPNTVSVFVGLLPAERTEYRDDGAGNMIKIAGIYSISSGTIDYATGILVLNFTVVPPNKTRMKAIFTFNTVTFAIQTILDINSSVNVTAFFNSNSDIQKAQIVAIGDFNSGQSNSNGPKNTLTYIPGSFINVSP